MPISVCGKCFEILRRCTRFMAKIVVIGAIFKIGISPGDEIFFLIYDYGTGGGGMM